MLMNNSIRSHEILTESGRQTIRIYDFPASDQVIRVLEGYRLHFRLFRSRFSANRATSGLAEIQRVVHRQQTRVVDVQKPGCAGARIVPIVKGDLPPPSIELINANGQSRHV